MKLVIGQFYKIIFTVGENILTFNCEILEDDGVFVSFKDKFGKTLSYNKKNIISIEEQREGNNASR